MRYSAQLRANRRIRGVDRLKPIRRSLVSVVIPCYNYEPYIAQAINSALAQPRVDVEVLVIDDCSTDNSADLAMEIAARDSRVSVYINKINRGPVETFNRGLARVRGSYVVRLDADDMLTPGSLSRAVALLDRHPNVGLVYGHPIHFTGSAAGDARLTARSWVIWSGRDWLRERCRTGVNCITSPEVVMRATTVKLVGGQREELPQTHDMEMWLRLAAAADVAYIRGADQAYHREHPYSRSAIMVTEPIIDLRERAAAFRVFFSGPGSVIDNRDELRHLANQAIARAALDSACRQFDRGRVDHQLIADLVEIALSSDPSSTSLPEWRRLRRRRFVGKYTAQYCPPFLAYAVWRHIRERVKYRRWQRIGV